MLCAFSDKLLSGCIDKLETYDHILDLGQMPYKWEVWVSYQIGVWYTKTVSFPVPLIAM